MPRPTSSPRLTNEPPSYPRPASSDPRPETRDLPARDPNPLREAGSFRVGVLAALWVAIATTPVAAQEATTDEPLVDRVTLDEILPVLEGSELGAIAIGPAPSPGTERRVRRDEVLAALAAHGRDARGLDIPRSVTVRRSLRALDPASITALLRPVVARALAPCELVELRGPARLELGRGTPQLEAEITAPLRAGGSVGGVVRVREAGREQRVAVRATVRCPDPEVSAGARVRVVVRIGAVLASATGVARQTGRIGDVIRITNEATRATLLARVVDHETVEVVR